MKKPSLFDTLQRTADISSSVNSELIRQLPIDSLIENPLNCFSMQEDEAFLRALYSIKQDGFLEDIIVTPTSDGRYRIVSGHRRVMIARRLCHTQVPCKVRVYATELDEIRALIGANLHRRTITPMDMAKQLSVLSQVLTRAGMSTKVKERTEQLAEQTGLSRATVERYLDLLNLKSPFDMWVNTGQIAMVDAYELARRKNSCLQQEVLNEVEKQNNNLPLSEKFHRALLQVKKNQTIHTKCSSKDKNLNRMLKQYQKKAHQMYCELQTFDNFYEKEIIEQLTLFEEELKKLSEICQKLRKQI